MNCRYVQSRLSAYLDCELSGQEQQQIRSHLEQCIECSCEFESLRRTKQLLSQIPVVMPRFGPEQVLACVRQATPVPRRGLAFRWHAPRWWQLAGGLALAITFAVWSRSEESTYATTTPDALLTPNFTASSPLLTPTVAPELLSVPRSPALFVSRSGMYSVSEPVLIPSVSYAVDPTLGYQPTGYWDTSFVQTGTTEPQR
ncbi:MAG: anti-sigma factor [Fimbriimonadales bacterium]|nr:anti-sigma factor [Fimbriimonadales bacterium]